MIPGIVAAQAGGGASSGVPDGALVHLDFINGIYFDGAMATAADVIGEPQYITGSGLAISYDNESSAGEAVVHVIGDALAALLTLNWTIVVEYEEFYSGGISFLLGMLNADWASYTKYVQLERWDAGDGLELVISDFDFNNGNLERTRGANDPFGPGIHRIAATRTNSKLAISVDGGGALVYNAAANAGVTAINATIGSRENEFLYNDFNFRRLTVYAPQDDAALPGLSAI